MEISKKLYTDQQKPRHLRQRDFVPHLVSESGEIKRGGHVYGSIFDDLNYGDYYLKFENP